MIGMRARLRALAAGAIVTSTLWAMGAALAHHGPAHPPKPRGAGPEDSISTTMPQTKKEKTPVVKPAPKVLAGASVATVAPGALAGLDPSHGGAGISPLGEQVTDEIIAHDHALMDALEAHLDTLPNAESDPWRATAAKSWITAARQEYDDHDPTGFPQAAFERAAGLVREIEAGEAPHTPETMPPTVPPRGSARVADSLHTQLEELKRHPGLSCAAAAIAELEVALAWAGNEQAGPGACAASPHLDRARALAAEAQRQAAECPQGASP